MARTKNTERKHTKGLLRARFSRIATGAEERNNFYRLTLQLPPQSASDWTSLTPSNVTSPELEKTVERLDAEHLDATMLELVEDLHKNPPTSSDGAEPASLDLEQQLEEMLGRGSFFYYGATSLCHQHRNCWRNYIPSSVIGQEGHSNANQEPARTSYSCHQVPKAWISLCSMRRWPGGEESPKAKPASSLLDIRKYQTEVKPIFLWLPFVRIVHELLYNRGPYKITREAIEALRTVGEGYLLECLEGANLAYMHHELVHSLH